MVIWNGLEYFILEWSRMQKFGIGSDGATILNSLKVWKLRIIPEKNISGMDQNVKFGDWYRKGNLGMFQSVNILEW